MEAGFSQIQSQYLKIFICTSAESQFRNVTAMVVYNLLSTVKPEPVMLLVLPINSSNFLYFTNYS